MYHENSDYRNEGKRMPLNTDQGTGRDRSACRLHAYDLTAGVAWVWTDGRPEPYRVDLYADTCTCPGYRAHGHCYHATGRHAFDLVFAAVGPTGGQSTASRCRSVAINDFMDDDRTLTAGEREADFRQWAEWETEPRMGRQVIWGG